ncbi:hypothetical protein ZEAMMB73_Zm00001d018764 [Zea mays]|uniref:DUF4220 domain-containing protein n=1 Tax=Zea mays TaxID=4577 RepID=A0A1D6HRZ4_MAIZE|nr:hypothetical protein ZEAMMB73_Zm00001d018764 [Zea mays]
MLTAAALLLIQLFLGFYRRPVSQSFLSTVCGRLPRSWRLSSLHSRYDAVLPDQELVVSRLGCFFVMASAGTTAVQDYDFCGSFYNKYMEGFVDLINSFTGVSFPSPSHGGQLCNKDHDFVFKKLLPSERDFKERSGLLSRAGLLLRFLLHKEFTVLETPNPIIQVRISRADNIITLLLLVIALIVELVHAAFYLASDWAQVLATMYVKRYWYEISPSIFATVIAFLRRVTFSGQLMRNRMKQHSVILGQRQQDPVEVSDAVKIAVARSLISMYSGNPTNDVGETSQWQDHRYSWALLQGLSQSQLEVMLIWHVATEYCHISGARPASATARGAAVHLSRYCAYLIGSVPELLPYHEADIAELAEKVTKERKLFGFSDSVSHDRMRNLQGTGEEDNPRKILQKHQAR